MVWRWVNRRWAVPGDVAVGLEEGLDRLHEPRLVLLVVGDERLHGLGVEALELGRVLAHRAQQQAIGARLLEGEHRAIGVALDHVGRQQRLGAGAMQVDRVGRGRGCARWRRCAPAGRSAARAGRRRRRARRGRVVGARERGRRSRRPPRPRARRSTAAAPGSTARAPRSATAEHALAPAVLGRHERVGAGDDDARALDQVDPELAAARRGCPRGRRCRGRAARAGSRPSACSEARSGARRRSTSEAIRVVHELDQRRAGLGSPRAHPQRAHGRVGHPQLDRLDPGARRRAASARRPASAPPRPARPPRGRSARGWRRAPERRHGRSRAGRRPTRRRR